MIIRWIKLFAGISSALFLTLILAVLAANGFSDPGLSVHGWIALAGGSVLTAALAVGLMGLTFYSNRSQHDIIVHQNEHTTSDERAVP